MGSASWSYFVPYQEDVGKALQGLRGQVSLSGNYKKTDFFSGAVTYDEIFGYNIYERRQFLKQNRKYLEQEGLYEAALLQYKKDKKQYDEIHKYPNTVIAPAELLFFLSGPEGTNSILDMVRIGKNPATGVVIPLAAEIIKDTFDTDKPTHQMIEALEKNQPGYLETFVDWWEGKYLIVYVGDEPSEIYFFGHSGD